MAFESKSISFGASSGQTRARRNLCLSLIQITTTFPCLLPCLLPHSINSALFCLFIKIHDSHSHSKQVLGLEPIPSLGQRRPEFILSYLYMSIRWHAVRCLFRVFNVRVLNGWRPEAYLGSIAFHNFYVSRTSDQDSKLPILLHIGNAINCTLFSQMWVFMQI